MAASTRLPQSSLPKKSSIWLTDQMLANGFAMPLPAMSGALPWMGSNIEGYLRSGLRLAPAARPMPPAMAAPRSVRISPKRLLVTTTSKRFGFLTNIMLAASTSSFCVLTSGYSLPSSAKISSQNTIE